LEPPVFDSGWRLCCVGRALRTSSIGTAIPLSGDAPENETGTRPHIARRGPRRSAAPRTGAPKLEKVRAGGRRGGRFQPLAIARGDEQRGTPRQFRPPQSVHVSFIDNTRLFLRVRRIKPEGLASWQRGKPRNRNRRACEPRIAILMPPSGPTRCSAHLSFVLSSPPLDFLILEKIEIHRPLNFFPGKNFSRKRETHLRLLGCEIGVR